ncbi:hypothetical protein [Micromonospora viridifaciens]|uniref:hypothetical protein n=1 Tax=Micromonospora viridifaciens TaxID=1881 RepID=UPI0012FD68B8|nr:hypothetical protein [Micromonospora viridifaciens]
MPLLSLGRLPSPGDGLWARRLLAAAAAAAVAAPVAAGLLRLPPREQLDLSCLVWLLLGARWLSRQWWPRRDGRLVWRVRVAGRYSTEPGLVARRSLGGWADLAAETIATAAIGVALISTLPDESGWAGLLRPLLAVGVAAAIGRVVYGEVRFTGRLALTASGIRHGRRTYGWTNIDRVILHKRDGRVDGVRLRPARWVSLEPAPVVGGRDTAVPEERLVAAIEQFRSRPEMLAVGLPVTAPEPHGIGC